VQDSNGKRRVEKLSSASAAPESVTVFDGEIARVLNHKANQGYLGPARRQYAEQDEDYLTFYANETGRVSFLDVFRDRRDVRLVVDPSDRDAVGIEAPPQEGIRRIYSTHGYTVWLDPKHGMLPSRIEIRRRTKDGENPWRRIVVNRFTAVRGGGWAPIEVAVTSLAGVGPIKGQPTQEAVTLVDMARSKWNEPVDESLFELAFPGGIFVLDDLRQITFVTGNSEPETDLEALAKSAQSVVPNRRPGSSQKPRAQ
jgi:hypothetical protein